MLRWPHDEQLQSKESNGESSVVGGKDMMKKEKSGNTGMIVNIQVHNATWYLPVRLPGPSMTENET